MSQLYKNSGIIVIAIVLCLILSVCSHAQAQPRVIPDHVVTTPFGQSIPLQSWSRAYDETVNRFRLLSEFNNEAVLDTETGIVYARNVNLFGRMRWRDAEVACANAQIGGRGGWRMPSNYEITSVLLVLPEAQLSEIYPFPSNSKFINVPTTDLRAAWWSGPFVPDEIIPGDGRAWSVHPGFIGTGIFNWNVELSDPNLNEFYVWPVRGYK